MQPAEFRALLDLLWSNHSLPEEQFELLAKFATREAKACGYRDWIDAYMRHELPPALHRVLSDPRWHDTARS